MIEKKINMTYGSDQNGLVCGFKFLPGQPACPVTSDEVVALLSTAEEEAFFWLNFSLSNSASEPWLRRNLSLPDAFYDSLHDEAVSTRLELEDDFLLAVIHDVLFDFTFDASSIATTSLCIRPRLLLSIRLRPLRSVDRLRISVRGGQTFRSSVSLLAHLLEDQANVLVEILRKSTLRVDEVEDRILANNISVRRRELGVLRRMLVRLQRLLAPEPAALFRLLNRPPDWISEQDLQDLRQAAEEFSAAIGDSMALVERIKLLQEELTALVNEQTSRSLFVLTVVTVLALPINMVAALFGMNVGGIPLSNHARGFLFILVPLIILTGILIYLVIGRHRDYKRDVGTSFFER